MSLYTLMIVAFALMLSISYIYFFTSYLEKFSQVIGTASLFLGIVTILLVFYIQSNDIESKGQHLILFVMFGFVSSVITLVSCIRFFIFPEMHLRSSHSLLRSRTDLSLPHKKFTITTEDNISITGFHINKGRKKIIIVCHGATRSKNILGDIMLCEGLANTYDVISFDFRGHNESKGTFVGNGATSLDVKAVVDYARQIGYEKIGVVGRSLGAWSAVINAARFHNIDSLIAAAAPMERLIDVGIAKRFPPYIVNTIGKIVARMIVGVRIGSIDGDISISSLIGAVSPIPLLLIYCQNDETIQMNQKDANSLYSLAKEPKKLVVLEGDGHILESKYSHHYYNIVSKWFSETL